VYATPAAAASRIHFYAKDPVALRDLLSFLNSPQKNKVDAEYKELLASFRIVLDFYMVAIQLLRRDLIDRPLFMGTFASGFSPLFDEMLEVNAKVKGVPIETIEKTNDFKKKCETWLKGLEQDNKEES
ncbi:MAG: hypothetical protein WCB99_07850, partial [Candidatus Cybelea sp.]